MSGRASLTFCQNANFENEARENFTAKRRVDRSGARAAADFVVDWVQVVVPSDCLAQVLEDVRRLTRSEMSPVRVPPDVAYKSGCSAGGISLYTGSRFGTPTALVVMPGRSGPSDHLPLLADLMRRGGRVTRIDFAFDDRVGLAGLDDLLEQMKAGHLVTRYKTIRQICSLGRDGNVKARTVTFGSRTSDVFIRAYEKGDADDEPAEHSGWLEAHSAQGPADQRRALANNAPMDNGSSDGNVPRWTRWELEVKGATAQKVVAGLIATVGEECIGPWDFPNKGLLARFQRLAIDLLVARLSFRERADNSNVTRSSLTYWWASVLEYFDPDREREMHADRERGGYVRQPEWADLQRQLAARQHREMVVKREANQLVGALYEEHRQTFGAFSKYRPANQNYRPRLRLVEGNKAITQGARSCARLRAVGAPSGWAESEATTGQSTPWFIRRLNKPEES